jgi:hypothetical protein
MALNNDYIIVEKGGLYFLDATLLEKKTLIKYTLCDV